MWALCRLWVILHYECWGYLPSRVMVLFREERIAIFCWYGRCLLTFWKLGKPGAVPWDFLSAHLLTLSGLWMGPWPSGFSLPVLTGSALLVVWWGDSDSLKGPFRQLLPGKPRNSELQWTCFFFSFLAFSFTHNSPFLTCLPRPNTEHKNLNPVVFHQLWLHQELASLLPYTCKRPFLWL